MQPNRIPIYIPTNQFLSDYEDELIASMEQNAGINWMILAERLWDNLSQNLRISYCVIQVERNQVIFTFSTTFGQLGQPFIDDERAEYLSLIHERIIARSEAKKENLK